MRKLLALALLAFPLLGQPATTIDTGNTGTGPTVHQNNPTINGVVTTVSVANAPVVGTTLNKVAKLTGAPSVAVIVGLTDTAGVLGIVVSGAGTTGNAQIARTGIAPCVFDGATTAGHYVGVSTSVAGDCTDLGATWPTTFVQILGRVWETNGGAGTYNVHIFGPEINGATPITPLIPGTNLVEQRNGTNGQKFEWYKTYTSATNFERVFIDAATDPLAYHIGSEYGSAGGSPRQLIFGGGSVTTDVAPEARQVQGKSAIGDSTATNKTGGPLILAGGLGTYYYTFVTPNSTGGKTFTITANGTAVVLTEGVDFNCNTLTTTQCAANLATAINANGTLSPLMTANGALAICNFTKKTTLYSLTLATNAGAPATATNGTNGTVQAPGFTLFSGLTFGTEPTNGGFLFTHSAIKTWLYQGEWRLGSGRLYCWSSNSDPTAAGPDTCMGRNAAGVVGVATNESSDGSGAIVVTTVKGPGTTTALSGATGIATLTYAASNAVSAEFLIRIQANDATNFQSLTTRVRVSSVRKATGNTVSAVGVVGTDLLAESAGGSTLTCTPTVTEGAGAVTLNENCTSSLTTTTFTSSFIATVVGPVTVAKL